MEKRLINFGISKCYVFGVFKAKESIKGNTEMKALCTPLCEEFLKTGSNKWNIVRPSFNPCVLRSTLKFLMRC